MSDDEKPKRYRVRERNGRHLVTCEGKIVRGFNDADDAADFADAHNEVADEWDAEVAERDPASDPKNPPKKDDDDKKGDKDDKDDDDKDNDKPKRQGAWWGDSMGDE